MAHQEQFEDAAAAAPAGISRRRLIVTGSTLAVAGVAVGAAIPLVTGQDSHAEAGAAGPAPTDPVMVHMRNADSGEFVLFVGERRAEFTDRALAAQLSRAAAGAS
ncbi:hypothetical protein [Actinophytocola sp.]|uniref:hypothetical protein n=1 Tax=Actinophytocola sp. TaxID=1872138 RepID=UPI002D807672|nr:hypothetical protein [Actinophytocola sp.]HET9142860.1 hypothetical protein [Actinophytocola sp.]